MVLPNFLIVGAPRCGTTALARYLGAHPDVYIAAEKEVRFFNRHFERGLAWYAAQFPATGRQAVGEATPSYIYDDKALERIARVLPDVRLIVSLREPVSRAYSHYWLHVSRAKVNQPFEHAVRAEMAGDTRYKFLQWSTYLPRLQRIAEIVSTDRLRVLFFEDLRDRPVATFESVCVFLDVDTTVKPDLLGRQINPALRYRSPRLRNWSKRLPGHMRSAVAMLNRAGDGAYPPLEPLLRAELTEFFRPHNEALGAWLGQDLGHWSPVVRQ